MAGFQIRFPNGFQILASKWFPKTHTRFPNRFPKSSRWPVQSAQLRGGAALNMQIKWTYNRKHESYGNDSVCKWHLFFSNFSFVPFLLTYRQHVLTKYATKTCWKRGKRRFLEHMYAFWTGFGQHMLTFWSTNVAQLKSSRLIDNFCTLNRRSRIKTHRSTPTWS